MTVNTQPPPAASEQKATSPQARETPKASVSDLLREIHLDARHDAVRYVLRSNTFHDGE